MYVVNFTFEQQEYCRLLRPKTLAQANRCEKDTSCAAKMQLASSIVLIVSNVLNYVFILL